MSLELLNKEDIESAGFIYEPDRSKCKAYKLKLYVPEVIVEEFKKAIVNEIMFKYVHQVKESENPYGPDFCSDPKVIVIGHTRL